MFLPHIAARERADVARSLAGFLPHEPQPAAAVSPIPIVISRQRHPSIDRGACLDVLCGSSWLPYSYHENAAAAVSAFNAFGWSDRQEPERWRVLCHALELGEFESVAISQPEPTY